MYVCMFKNVCIAVSDVFHYQATLTNESWCNFQKMIEINQNQHKIS